MRRQIFGFVALSILVLSILLSIPDPIAQSADVSAPSVQWSKDYDGASANCVITTSDQGYLIGSSPLISTPDTVLELIKTDSAGTQVWLQTYPGFPGNVLVEQTSDNGYILAGTTADNPSKFFAAKIDSSGVVVWNTTYSDAKIDRVTHLVKTSDGGFAIFGDSIDSGYSVFGALLVKADSFGQLMWNHTYSGQRDLMPNGLSQTSDGGYVLEVTTTYFDFSVWLIKVDALGNTQWYRPFQGYQVETGLTQIYGSDMISTVEGGYFFISRISWYQANISSYASAALAFKTDANGDQQWNQTYSNLYSEAIQTAGEGYVLGQASSGMIILSQVDGLGNLQWNGSYSVTADSNARFVIATSDGGFALTGTSQNRAVLIKLEPAASTSPVQLPQAIPHAMANATILSQILIPGVGATSTIQTSDGGYAVVGQVSNIEGQAYSLLVKTDSSLNIQWNRTIQFDVDTYMSFVLQTQDGSYAVVGEIGTDAGWAMQFVLAKYSSSGQLLWNQTYPLSASHDIYNYLEGFIQTIDGGFLFAATTSYADTLAPYMVRTNSSGDLIWAKSLTSASGVPFIGIAVASLVQASDGGFTIIGSDRPHSAISSSYFELLHVDTNGNVTWSESYGNQNGEFHSSVGGGITTSDGGYLLVGSYTLSYSSPYSVLLVKTDSLGNLVWTQMFDQVPISSAGAIRQTGDGGYIFSSSTDRFICLVKVTSTGQFQGILTIDTIFRENYGDSIADVRVDSGGAYIIAGQYAGFNNSVYDDIWLAKLTLYLGDISPTPSPTITASPTPNSTPTPTQNPTRTATPVPTQTSNPTPINTTPAFTEKPSPSPTIPELNQTLAVTLTILLITALVAVIKKSAKKGVSE